MANKGRSEPNLFGGYTNYDSKGRKIGRSEPNLFGGYTNYDAKGNKIGRSDPAMFGGYNHYDNRGKKTGHTDPAAFGGYHHYDAKGKRTGSSDPKMFGGYSHSDSTNEGCYVATCVYGSYDCPQVWTLRRFRDDTLGATVLGRAFIRTYYAISPAVVRMFGEKKGFRSFWRKRLDRLVRHLRGRGVEDTPYRDKNWR